MSSEPRSPWADQVMPGSAYNIDDIGPGTIWKSTVSFHDELKLRAIRIALEEIVRKPRSFTEAIDLVEDNHVVKALDEINREISLKIDISGIDKEVSQVIRSQSRQFEDDIMTRAKKYSKGRPVQMGDVTRALENINPRWRELLIAGGSGLIGVFFGELLNTIPNGNLPSSLHGIALAVGVIMVMWRWK